MKNFCKRFSSSKSWEGKKIGQKRTLSKLEKFSRRYVDRKKNPLRIQEKKMQTFFQDQIDWTLLLKFTKHLSRICISSSNILPPSCRDKKVRRQNTMPAIPRPTQILSIEKYDGARNVCQSSTTADALLFIILKTG